MRWFFKKQIRPQRHDAQDGTLGENSNRDERSTFRPSWEQLRGHSVIFSNLGMGKSTLIGQLANAAIQNGDALVVIDMEGDLAPALLAQVPPSRAKDVCWIDTNASAHIPGFNVLDVSHGEPSDLIVANLVHSAHGLWGEYWKPDVGDALRVVVRTLLAANRVLVRRTEPQLTLLDVKRLFELPNFCRHLLQSYATDRCLIEWWNGYLERPSWLNLYDFAALLTPLDRLTDHDVARILGQSDSSFNLRERLEPGRITLFDLSGMAFDTGLRSWFGALLADRINLTVLAREQVAPEIEERHIVIAVNGFLTIPCVDEPGFLADLRERGASHILSDWSAPESQMLLASMTNLFAFRTWGRDAQVLAGELGGGVLFHDIVDLANHVFYFRRYAGNREVFVERFTITAPPASATHAVRRIPEQVKPCGRNASGVKVARERFHRRWNEREGAALLDNAESRPPRG